MTIRAGLIAIPALFFGWLLVLVVVGLFADEAPAFVVVLPSEKFVANLPVGASVMASSRTSITVRSDAPLFARSLYKSGAWLVLPAGLAGCLPLPKAS